jgi:MFS family permease
VATRTSARQVPAGVGRRPGTSRTAPVERNVLIMALTSGTLNMAVLVWNPVLPLLLRAEGASSLDVVWVYTALGAANYAFQYVGGVWAERVGRRRAIAVPTAVAGIGFALASRMPNWAPMAALLLVSYACFAIQSPSFVTLLADSVPEDRRAGAFARFQLAGGISSVIGPLIGFVLLPRVPGPDLLLGTGCVYLLGGTARALLLCEPPRSGRQRGRVSAADLGRGDGLRLLLVSLGVTLVTSLTVSGPFFTLFAHHVEHLSGAQIDLLFAIGPIGAVAVSHLAGVWVRRVGGARILALGLLAQTGALLAWPLLPGLAGGAAVFIASYMGYQAVNVAFSEYRVALAAGSGAIIGATGSLSGAAFLGGPPAGGALRAWLPVGPFLLAAAAALATAWLGVRRPAAAVEPPA